MYLDGEPAAGCLGYFGIFQTEETGDGRACEVDVEDSYRFACEGEREGELDGDGGLADAAFAREYLESCCESSAGLRGRGGGDRMAFKR